MKNSTLIWIALVIVAALSLGAYMYPTNEVQTLAGSPTGTTFSTAKIAAINFTPSASAASSTSMLNSDASDREITSTFNTCAGVNGQGITITGATTSVANLGLQGNPNLISNMFGTTTTSAKSYYVSTTTEGVLSGTSRVWPAGTYLTFVASSTTSGVCTVGAHYLAL